MCISLVGWKSSQPDNLFQLRINTYFLIRILWFFSGLDILKTVHSKILIYLRTFSSLYIFLENIPFFWEFSEQLLLTLSDLTPQNCQTSSNNSSAIADKLSSVFDHFVGMVLKGLKVALKGYFWTKEAYLGPSQNIYDEVFP